MIYQSNASDCNIGAILGQRRDKKLFKIYHARKILDEAQVNYSATEEMLMVMFVIEKFQQYLLGSKVIVYIDHSAIKHLFEKKDKR